MYTQEEINRSSALLSPRGSAFKNEKTYHSLQKDLKIPIDLEINTICNEKKTRNPIVTWITSRSRRCSPPLIAPHHVTWWHMTKTTHWARHLPVRSSHSHTLLRNENGNKITITLGTFNPTHAHRIGNRDFANGISLKNYLHLPFPFGLRAARPKY